ncbi:MAG: class I SAM-dependent methyltransferase [Proteobacteria bacterium]|nr:class I SAM-dependent methyltransferase [Pseudomonadota bacterium]
MKTQIVAAGLFVLALSGAAFAAAMPDVISNAVADQTRPKDDRDADAIRAPAETLAFAGVKPGMTVAEMYPCGAYFSRMIADVVGPTGKVIGFDNKGWKGCLDASQKAIAEGHTNFSVSDNDFGAFTLSEPVDLFWITQNYHDLHIKKYGDVDMAKFNRHVFDSLKPGGTYFILDHQANGALSDDEIAKLHRISKDQVIAEVTAAGFKYVGEGDFLHRPGDDHTMPIFDKSIRGHTDQYALKFVKP